MEANDKGFPSLILGGEGAPAHAEVGEDLVLDESFGIAASCFLLGLVKRESGGFVFHLVTGKAANIDVDCLSELRPLTRNNFQVLSPFHFHFLLQH